MYCIWDNRAGSMVSVDVRSASRLNEIRKLGNLRLISYRPMAYLWLNFLERLCGTAEHLLTISRTCLSQDGWGSRALDSCMEICGNLSLCVEFCFPPECPVNADQQERTLLKGVFSVRKGKSQLHKWAERQVILCGTCLIVASVKDSMTGKMHILPLVGGKVRVQFWEITWCSFFIVEATLQCSHSWIGWIMYIKEVMQPVLQRAM